jgi:TATA-binding protein-associated factor Taf7
VIGNDSFPAALLDLPCVVESYKTYDDSVLIKAADVGQVSAPCFFFFSCLTHASSPSLVLKKGLAFCVEEQLEEQVFVSLSLCIPC